MSTVQDYGAPTDLRDTPSASAWASAVSTEITGIRTDLDAFLADAHFNGEADWTPLTLVNGWVDFSAAYAPARYRKLPGNLVTVHGLIAGGTAKLCATLPEGYRPPFDMIVGVMCDGPGGGDTSFGYSLSIRRGGTLEIRRTTFTYAWYTIDTTFSVD